MANMFSVTKTESSRLRKLPLLPRFGIMVDVAGLRFTYKHAPLLETVLNARERGLSVTNLLKVAREQLAEIDFPAATKRALSVVKSSREAKAGATVKAAPVKKAPAKAAAKKKAEPTTLPTV